MANGITPPRAVYGTLLNDRSTLTRLAGAFTQQPYKAPPVHPVLYIKPANTHAPPGARVEVPADPGVVRIDATLGVVFLRNARRVQRQAAMHYIGGYVIASDITLPHDDLYRPPLLQRCRDGFCPITPPMMPDGDFNPDQAVIDISINGKRVHRRSLADLHRSIGQLITDVSADMTLGVDDVLLVGAPDNAPLARPGDHVRIDVHGLGSLEHTLVAEGAAQ